MSMSDERKTQDQTPPGSSANAGSGGPADNGSNADAGPAEPGPTETAPSESVPAGDPATGKHDERGKPTASADASPRTPSETPSAETASNDTAPGETPPREPVAGVYFFPDRVVTGADVRRMLSSDSEEEKAEAVGRLLTYAEYDEIWTWVDRDTVRDLFDRLDLPDRLRAAWARNLGLVAKAPGHL